MSNLDLRTIKSKVARGSRRRPSRGFCIRRTNISSTYFTISCTAITINRQIASTIIIDYGSSAVKNGIGVLTIDIIHIIIITLVVAPRKYCCFPFTLQEQGSKISKSVFWSGRFADRFKNFE